MSALLLCWNINKCDKAFQSRIDLFIRVGFIAGLILTNLTLARLDLLKNINLLAFITNISFRYIIVVIALSFILGFLILCLNKNNIRISINEEKDNELKSENKREKDFVNRFRGLYSSKKGVESSASEGIASYSKSIITFCRCIIAWCLKRLFNFFKSLYRTGWLYLLVLLIILLLFTLVKYPYFAVSFTGVHTMKYNSYVEPAKYMYERDDPFWNQKKYLADPVNNPQGVSSTFGSPPLIEWGLLALFKLFPNNSMEFNTRLLMHVLGIVVLLLAYIFFTKWFSKTFSLLVTYLISINPIINFMTFVTVEDTILIIFTFLALIYISNYLQNNKLLHLYFAGLYFGIGIACKVSVFLWLAPIILVILAFNSKDLSFFIRDYALILFLSVLPLIAFRTSLRYLPSDASNSIVVFFIWLGAFYLLYYGLKRYEDTINLLFEIIVTRKLALISATIVAVVIGYYLISILGIKGLTAEFLTDSSLIFYWDMYGHMLNMQFKYYMTPQVFYLGFVGIVVGFIYGNRDQRIILAAFFTGTFVYWILSSKVMFFHNYYTAIIMITFALGLGMLFYLLCKSSTNKLWAFMVCLLLLIIVVPDTYQASIDNISYERAGMEDFKKVARYLMMNTEEDEIYIDDSYLLTLTLMTGRARIEESKLDNSVIKKSIREIGFANTMEKYNIVFLITARDHPRYERYANLFVEEGLSTISYRRSDFIRSLLDSDNHYFPDFVQRQQIVDAESLVDKFILVQEYGTYKIFAFAD